MPQRKESGSSVLGTLLGAGVFVLLLLFAVQILMGLFTSSVVNAATYDAAKAVASASVSGETDSRFDAERNAQTQLGGYGRRVTFDWSQSDADVVRLTARGPRLTFLPASLTGPAGLGDIVRRVAVRRERLR